VILLHFILALSPSRFHSQLKTHLFSIISTLVCSPLHVCSLVQSPDYTTFHLMHIHCHGIIIRISSHQLYGLLIFSMSENKSPDYLGLQVIGTLNLFIVHCHLTHSIIKAKACSVARSLKLRHVDLGYYLDG